MAKQPGDKNTGRYSDHFDRATGMSLQNESFATIDCPMFSQGEGIRITRPLTVLPPQLTLEDEVGARENWDSELSSFVADMPPVYDEHPVVLRSATKPIPLAIYFDGVQYATRNSLIGFWCVNLVSGRRHLVCSIRKGSLCRCGCHGWCTLWPIFDFLRWATRVLSWGRHAAIRCDGQDFLPGEINLKIRANLNCPLAAVIYLKADLAEFGGTLGFWTTASNNFPCFLCNTKRHSMLELDQWDAATHPFSRRTWEDYNGACARCEQWRHISRDQHVAAIELLVFDRRKQSKGKGYCLKADFAPCGLLRWDRLEPWNGCRDILDFDRLSVYPAKVLFWRSSQEGMSHHRNPLFDASTGILPETTIALDWMHTLSLCGFRLGELWLFIASLMPIVGRQVRQRWRLD